MGMRLVPVMTGAQTRTYWGLVISWLAANAFFWSWWLRPEHVVTPLGMIVTSTMLLWTTLLP